MGENRLNTGPIIVRVVIRGRVQGVGFRAWVEFTALRLGLQGWVRNLQGGAVEAAFSGPNDKVAAMIDACRRGPPSARVDGIDRWNGGGELLMPCRRGEMFSVLPTA